MFTNTNFGKVYNFNTSHDSLNAGMLLLLYGLCQAERLVSKQTSKMSAAETLGLCLGYQVDEFAHSDQFVAVFKLEVADNEISLADFFDVSSELEALDLVFATSQCSHCAANLFKGNVLEFAKFKNLMKGYLLFAKPVNEVTSQATEQQLTLADFFALTDSEAVIANNKLLRRNQVSDVLSKQQLDISAVVIDSIELPVRSAASNQLINLNFGEVYYLADKTSDCELLGQAQQLYWCSENCEQSAKKGRVTDKAFVSKSLSFSDLALRVEEHSDFTKLSKITTDLCSLGFGGYTFVDKFSLVEPANRLLLRLILASNIGLTNYRCLVPELGMFDNSQLDNIIKWLLIQADNLALCVCVSDYRLSDHTSLLQINHEVANIESTSGDLVINLQDNLKKRSQDFEKNKYQLVVTTNDKSATTLKITKHSVQLMNGSSRIIPEHFFATTTSNTNPDYPWQHVELITLNVNEQQTLGEKIGVFKLLAELINSTSNARIYNIAETEILNYIQGLAANNIDPHIVKLSIADIKLEELARSSVSSLHAKLWQYPLVGELLSLLMLAGFARVALGQPLSQFTVEQLYLIELLGFVVAAFSPSGIKRASKTLLVFDDPMPCRSQLSAQKYLNLLDLLEQSGYTVILFSKCATFNQKYVTVAID